jgi:bifunctional non-homologous end joining protein LigD
MCRQKAIRNFVRCADLSPGSVAWSSVLSSARSLGKKVVYPGFVAPALATNASKVPSGAQWLHEVKFDGYRVQLHIHAESIRVFTRRGFDWTDRFAKIVEDAWHLKAKSAIVDGEVIVPGSEGISDFAVLQKELRGKRPSRKLVMYAFDLLYINGYDLRREPLVERKVRLQRLLERSRILLSQHFEVDGAEMFKRACAYGLEGIVSKQRDSRYQSDRTHNWRKVTCRTRETLRIVGYALKQGRFDGIYLGREEDGALNYAGKVENGFSDAVAADVIRRMKPLVQSTQAYTTRIRKPKAVWVKPELLAEIEYRAQSEAGKLRHPSFKGLRDDLA